MQPAYPMIVLFTDFGSDHIYTGQMKAVLARYAPAIPVIDLLHTVAAFDVASSAHLLDALQHQFPVGAAFCCVVDPGVGSSRHAVALRANGRWFVGPDNGLLSIVAARTHAADQKVWRIVWRPNDLACSFHGRGLFAPITSWLASSQFPDDALEPVDDLSVKLDPADLSAVIYVDHYGNVMTGLRAAQLDPLTRIVAAGRVIEHAEVFSAVPEGQVFWYRNSIGLVEIARNRGDAARSLGLKTGDAVRLSAAGAV